MGRWSALHVHLHAGSECTETVLREHIVPATTDLLARGEISSWFFIRYWEGGPHLRWRVADATPETVRRMRAGLVEAVAALPPPARELRPADWYAQFGVSDSDSTDQVGVGHGIGGGPDLDWQPHGTVLEQPYRAEVDRYGGPDAIGAAEELFAASSRVAAALLGAPPARRRSTAVDLLFGFLTASGLAAHEAVRFLRGYANTWTLVPEAHGQDLGLALIAAERDFHADESAYPARQRLIADIVTRRKGASTSVNYWADEVAAYVERLRTLDGQGRLHATIPGVLASQLHMLHNRLGLSIPAECHLAWLASLAYGAPAGAPDFHLDGIDAPDRAYHERSKFVRTRWPNQRPRTVELASDRPSPTIPPGTETLTLPEPTPGALADTTLAEVLLGRRTRYDFGRGEADVVDLGRLLRYAAGDTAPPGSGQRRLAYPTPGALATTRLLVLPRRVASVRAALYEYLPERHALQRVAPDPGTDRLSRVAPQFAPAGSGRTAGSDAVVDSGGLDAEAVPLWVFVVADLRRARARYGLRGYRFSAMETGHLAQNLLLAATAVGLSAAPLGGFFDDELNHLLLLDGLDSSVFYALTLG
ncbi:thiopeptide-type bacteriocin biosynthesis protein [Micromonospora peucetia]|uniref:thiopeptide-type bacteriocin biosynthesis protein n=1 Tax=Micromonospora peucetia TaxID=47871 RepID=UPI0022541D16|nr:thiopeptide-type bacteriocin biosynthesis protein [Micromonospora peucetia]MCX4389114.1 thiopeptide-type bacteriocin biosynthesis protein [Micromonospora peucetia]